MGENVAVGRQGSQQLGRASTDVGGRSGGCPQQGGFPAHTQVGGPQRSATDVGGAGNARQQHEVSSPKKRLYELLDGYAKAEASGCPPTLRKLVATHDYPTSKFGMLSIKAGDIISVLEAFDDKWSFGVVNRTVGMFPIAVTRPLEDNNNSSSSSSRNYNNTDTNTNTNNTKTNGAVGAVGSRVEKMEITKGPSALRGSQEERLKQTYQKKQQAEKEDRENEVDLCGEEFVMNLSCLLDSGALELLVIENTLWVTLSNGNGLVLSTENLKAVCALEGLTSSRSYVLLDSHPAANEVFIMNEKGILFRYDRTTCAFLGRAESQHQGMVKCGVVANNLLWTGDVMGCVCVWDVQQGCLPVKRFRIGDAGHSHGSTSSLTSPLGDPRYAALSMCFIGARSGNLEVDEVWVGSSGRIHRYNAINFTKLGELTDYPGSVDVTRLCLARMNVFSSGNDALVRVWDPLSPEKCLDNLKAHTGRTLCVESIEGDVPLVASSGFDAKIHIWRTGTRTLFQQLPAAHKDSVRSVRFRNNKGSSISLFSGSREGVLCAWTLLLPVGLKNEAPPCFTREEIPENQAAKPSQTQKPALFSSSDAAPSPLSPTTSGPISSRSSPPRSAAGSSSSAITPLTSPPVAAQPSSSSSPSSPQNCPPSFSQITPSTPIPPPSAPGKGWLIKIIRKTDKTEVGEIVVPVGEKFTVGRKEFGEVKFISRGIWEVTGKEDCLQILVLGKPPTKCIEDGVENEIPPKGTIEVVSNNSLAVGVSFVCHVTGPV